MNASQLFANPGQNNKDKREHGFLSPLTRPRLTVSNDRKRQNTKDTKDCAASCQTHRDHGTQRHCVRESDESRRMRAARTLLQV